MTVINRNLMQKLNKKITYSGIGSLTQEYFLMGHKFTKLQLQEPSLEINLLPL